MRCVSGVAADLREPQTALAATGVGPCDSGVAFRSGTQLAGTVGAWLHHSGQDEAMAALVRLSVHPFEDVYEARALVTPISETMPNPSPLWLEALWALTAKVDQEAPAELHAWMSTEVRPPWAPTDVHAVGELDTRAQYLEHRRVIDLADRGASRLSSREAASR